MPEVDVEFFVENGYLVVPGLLSPAEVEVGRDEALRFARGDYPLSNAPQHAADATDDELVASLLAVHFPHWVSAASLGLVRHAGVCDVLSKITGAHLPHWDGRVKCMQSMLFLKPPGLQGQAWHQDERFIPTRDRSLVGAWIALDDADAENGCLWVLPGSHRMGYLHPTRPHTNPEEFDPSDEAFGFDDDDAVLVEVAAGDVVFFNGYLLHRSFRNRSQRTRRALVNHYMNVWSQLPWLMSKGIDVGTEDNRLVVPVTGQDPYAWKGYADPPAQTFVRPHARAAKDERTHVDTRVDIEAPIETVWAVLTDFAGYAAWNPYMVEVAGVSIAGSTAAVTTVGGMGLRSVDSVVVAVVDPPTRMVWHDGLPDPAQLRGEHEWLLEPSDSGGTSLQHHQRWNGAQALRFVADNRAAVTTGFEQFNEALRMEAIAQLDIARPVPGTVSEPVPIVAPMSPPSASQPAARPAD